MVRKWTGSLLGAAYVLIGAVLLGAALFAPWYSFDSYYEQRWGTPSTGYMAVVGPSQLDFYLFALPGSGTVQTTCPAGNVTNFCPASSSYSAAGLNHTGSVVAVTFALAAAGFAAATIGGILGVVLRRRARPSFPERTLAVVAVALAFAAVAAFAVLLPGAFAHDVSASQRGLSPSGPWSSFTGSVIVVFPFPCPAVGCLPTSTDWGPSIGWCFSVAAIPILLLGAIMTVRFRHDVREPVPAEESVQPRRSRAQTL